MGLNDQIQQMTSAQNSYFTNKLLKEQQREKEKRQREKFQNARVNIEVLLLDYFKDINNRAINQKDFKSLLNDIESTYINNNDFTEYQKDALELFTKKKILQLKKAKIVELNKQEKEAAKLEKDQQKQKSGTGCWWFCFIILWIFFFCLTM